MSKVLSKSEKLKEDSLLLLSREFKHIGEQAAVNREARIRQSWHQDINSDNGQSLLSVHTHVSSISWRMRMRIVFKSAQKLSSNGDLPDGSWKGPFEFLLPKLTK